MTVVPAPIAKHPNASTATGLGGISVLTVFLAGHFGVKLGAEEASVISGAVTSIGLVIGKRGIKGVIRVLWRGSNGV